MPKLIDAARVTTAEGAVWRACNRCGQLAALAPDETHCPTCVGIGRSGGRQLLTRDAVRALSAAGITAAQDVYTGPAGDALKVTVLTEIAAAAATFARHLARLRHLDPQAIAGYVTNPVDLYAVLGRGQWLPTMCSRTPMPSVDATELAEAAEPIELSDDAEKETGNEPASGGPDVTHDTSGGDR